MTYREAILDRATAIQDKVAGASVLWKYVDPESNDFYLMKKQVGSIRSPYTGKSFTGKPERFSLSDVGKELKQDAKEEKTASGLDFWKESCVVEPDTSVESPGEVKLAGKTLPGALWEYVDEEGNKFFLSKKQTGTIRSPFSGKSFSAKPVKNTLSDVGKDLKQESKTACEDPSPLFEGLDEPSGGYAVSASEELTEETSDKEASVEELWKVDPSFGVLKEACGCGSTETKKAEEPQETEKPWEQSGYKSASEKTSAQILSEDLLGTGDQHPSLQVVAKEWESLLEGVKLAQDLSKTISGSDALLSNLPERLRNLARTASIVAFQLEQRLK